MVLGSDWKLGCWYGRGSNKSQILQKKKDMSPIAFDQNYGGRWTGSSSNSLVNINKLMNCRSLTAPIFKQEHKTDEYFMGVDVARSQHTNNNQSFVVVGRVIRNPSTNRIISIDIVHLYHISNIMNFTAQACVIKKIKNAFNAKVVVVDGNGLGAGLIDELLKNSFDPITQEPLGCWNTINTDNQPEDPNAERCLYDLKAQTAQSKIVTTFIDMVESGKLRLLEKRHENIFSEENDSDFETKVLPFMQTDLLVEEVSNLKIKYMPSGGLSVEKVVSKLDKDRFSALAYLLWYVNEYENVFINNQEFDYEHFESTSASINFE